jgi:phosphoglycolate phosphatase
MPQPPMSRRREASVGSIRAGRRTFEALIFDLDGTLVDSYEAIAESLNTVRARFGLPPLGLPEVRRAVGHGLPSLIRENVGDERTPEGVRLFRARYRRIYRERTRWLPGVEPVLHALAARGVPMAITSNKPAYFSREIVAALGARELFTAVLGPEMVLRPKPDPEMVLMAVETLKIPLPDVLYVGDMTIDIDTCRRAGLAVAVIPGGSDTPEALEAANPDFLLAAFEEVLALVRA